MTSGTSRSNTRLVVCLLKLGWSAWAAAMPAGDTTILSSLRSRSADPTLGSPGEESSFHSLFSLGQETAAAAADNGQRRLEESGFVGNTDSSTIVGDIFMYLFLVLFIVALIFPASALTYARLCCCCSGSELTLPCDSPPMEVQVIDEPTGNYQLVQQVSSTTMGSSDHHLPPIE